MEEQNKDDIGKNLECTILITDSNGEFLEVLRSGLEEQGYSAIACQDKLAALVTLNKRKSAGDNTHVVISNIRSPVTAGYEFLRRTKKEHPDTKFIFYTGGPVEYEIDKARAMGANALVRKDYYQNQGGLNLEPLCQSIEKVLRGEPFFVVQRGN